MPRRRIKILAARQRDGHLVGFGMDEVEAGHDSPTRPRHVGVPNCSNLKTYPQFYRCTWNYVRNSSYTRASTPSYSMEGNMKSVIRRTAPLLLLALLAACRGETQQQMTAEAMGVMMGIPVTTTADVARQQLEQGIHASDMGRGFDARDHLDAAIEADPTFAYAYLNRAYNAQSQEEFLENVRKAVEYMEGASEAERIEIQMGQKSLQNDVDGQLELGRQLVEIIPNSPRAWVDVSFFQSNANKHVEARASLAKAIDLAPDFAAAHLVAANSYLNNEPKDFTRAEAHARRVIELEPNEKNSHDIMGDIYRAQSKLADARDSYTRAAELAPNEALPVQQRGHVNSFLGDYDAARADYDAAIALGRGNEPAGYRTWRAYVNIYAGDPEAAIEELSNLVDEVDAMGVPGPRGIKVGALTDIAQIQMHNAMYDKAAATLAQRAVLAREQAELTGTDEARRGTEANIAFLEGQLAARRGNYETAIAKVNEIMTLLDPVKDPTKNEPAHYLMGLTAELQGDYTGALAQYDQANQDNISVTYHRAICEEGAGNTAQAKRLFGEVARFNFNFVDYALIRNDAIRRAS